MQTVTTGPWHKPLCSMTINSPMPADGLCITLTLMWLSCDCYLGKKYSLWDPLICHSHQEKTGSLAYVLCVGILTKYILTEW